MKLVDGYELILVTLWENDAYKFFPGFRKLLRKFAASVDVKWKPDVWFKRFMGFFAQEHPGILLWFIIKTNPEPRLVGYLAAELVEPYGVKTASINQYYLDEPVPKAVIDQLWHEVIHLAKALGAEQLECLATSSAHQRLYKWRGFRDQGTLMTANLKEVADG